MLAAVLFAATAGPLEAQVVEGPTGSAASAPSASQADPSADQEDAPEPTTTVQGVTVVAHRRPQPGAVVGDIKPEVQLSPADVQSFGVSTVNELLEELTPETRSDRGRGGEMPVVLLNGRRISSLNEIQNIPTEAILRVDILPEEVSLKYGYTADQRVVDIVLRRRFRAITGELAGGGATEGGEATGQAEVDLLHILRDDRLNLDLKYTGKSEITDAARDIIEPTPNTPYALSGNVTSATAGAQVDPRLSALTGQPVTVAGIPGTVGARAPTLGDFDATAGVPNTTYVGADRTLQPATQSLTANAVLAHPLPLGVNATVNGTFGATTSQSLQGLPGVSLTVPAGDPFSPFAAPVSVDRYVDTPLRQSVDGATAHLGSTLNKDASDWRLSLTDAYDFAYSQTDTDVGFDTTALQASLNGDSAAVNPFAALPSLAELPQSTAHSVSNAANIQLLANGPLFTLPTGQLYASAKAGDTQSWLSSASQRFGATQDIDLSRNDANAQVNMDLPVASREHHVLGLLGELSLNVNAAVDQLSDYGALKAFGYGINWTPIPGYNLIVSHTNDQAAPTIQQLGAPAVDTPGVRLFDYATGQTVTIAQITGGNPALSADNRNVLKVGLTLKPFSEQNFTFTANFIKSDVDHAVETFPAADATIEAAFPDRFIRNSDGELIEEDERPVDFTRTEREELRWGFDYSRAIGPQPPPRPDWRRRLAGADHRESRSAIGASTNGGPDTGPQVASGGGAGSSADPPEANGSASSPSSGGSDEGGGRGGRGGGGFGGAGRGGFGRGGGGGPGGRLQFAVYHTVYFVDRVLVRPGGPTLDLLNGAAASSNGGQYRNEVQAQLGMTLLGFGARLSADWRSATVVQGGAGSAAGDLFFSDVTTINLRLFDNLGQQPGGVKQIPWLRGARISLNITNLFDQRIDVRDSNGATPVSYQAGYIDPVGRAITLSLRKLFF